MEKLEKIQSVNLIDFPDINFEVVNSFSIEYLENIISQLENEEANLIDLNNKKSNVDKWRIKIDQEIESFLKEHNYCPTCSQKIDRNHILGEHHA